jgi:RES domain-containing protein
VLTIDTLVNVLRTLPTYAVKGAAYRSILTIFANAPLSVQGALLFGGRYNVRQSLPQGFGALYLADSRETARREVRTVVDTAVGIYKVSNPPPRTEFSVDYSLNSVLDMTDPNIQTALETNFQELTGLWVELNNRGQIAPTQVLGRAAYELETIEALKVHSVWGGANAYNIVVFTDRLSSGSFLRALDESGTIQARLP